MGYPFTDLGAEGCRRSLNALFIWNLSRVSVHVVLSMRTVYCLKYQLDVWWPVRLYHRNYWWTTIAKGVTHWGRVTHICVVNLTIIGSDNGLSPGRRQAITWTNVGILLIGPLWTHFSEMLIEIHTFSFKKIHLKMSSGKLRLFCLGPNVLMASRWRHGNVWWRHTHKYAASSASRCMICGP